MLGEMWANRLRQARLQQNAREIDIAPEMTGAQNGIFSGHGILRTAMQGGTLHSKLGQTPVVDTIEGALTDWDCGQEATRR